MAVGESLPSIDTLTVGVARRQEDVDGPRVQVQLVNLVVTTVAGGMGAGERPSSPPLGSSPRRMPYAV